MLNSQTAKYNTLKHTLTIEVKPTGIDASNTSQNVEVKLPKENKNANFTISPVILVSSGIIIIATGGLLYKMFGKK